MGHDSELGIMPPRARLSLCSFVFAWTAVCASTPAVHAQASLSGTWRAGATSMKVAIESWGKDCGPRPQSTQSAGGGNVELQQRGQAVIIRGADREVRSDRCWSPNPAMRKLGSTSSNGVWTTRCKTAGDDPRQETGTYSLRALGPDELEYRDVSHFDWRLNDSSCVASITTTQTLQRVAAPGRASRASPPATAAHAAETEAAPCTPGKPGKPARIVLRPRRADLELGQRQCFRARVLDAAGCELAGIEPRWSLRHAPAIKGELQRGCFQAGERSAESEGSFEVVATHAGLRAAAAVEVSAVSFPALLAKRLETGAVKGEPLEAEATAPAPRAASTSRVAAKALDAPAARDRRLLVAVAALLAAAAGALLFARARPRRPPGGPASAASAGVARESGEDHALRASPTRIRRCPACGAGYPETSAFCGEDGSALASPE